MATSERITYKDHFANEIRSLIRSGVSAIDCADKFRDKEWMIIDHSEYARNTRLDLYELANNDKQLLEFTVDVIQCMRYNVSQIED